MAKGGTTPTTQTTETQLSPQQQELMGLAMPGLRKFAAATPERYQGGTIAGFTPTQIEAQAAARRGAGSQESLAEAGGRTLLRQLQGGTGTGGGEPNLPKEPFGENFYDPGSNPILKSAIGAATRPITENLAQNILPQLRGEAVTTGGFGGSRQGIAEGLASQGALRQVGDTAANLAQSTYGTNVNALANQFGTSTNAALRSAELSSGNQLRALGLLPQLQEAQTAGARTLGGLGDAEQQLEQARINEQVGNFNFDQYAPFLQSKEIMSLMAGLPGGRATTTASGPTTSPWMAGLGGATTGASLGSMFGPWGAGIGAVGGGLAGLLSSRR